MGNKNPLFYRRHYKWFVEFLKRANLNEDKWLIAQLCLQFELDNERFDAERFKEALK